MLCDGKRRKVKKSESMLCDAINYNAMFGPNVQTTPRVTAIGGQTDWIARIQMIILLLSLDQWGHEKAPSIKQKKLDAKHPSRDKQQ
jgi:hypothetical protein